jgi:hypothetical protein
VSSRLVPDARSITTSRNRSASCPGRLCARYAIHFPSGENFGEPSNARLAAVRFRGVPPANGTTQTSEFVETASTESGFIAETKSLPSGDTSKSRSPPTENGGTSRSPGVRSTAVPPETGTFHTCVRRPSFHESQWRNRSRSAIRAFVGDFSRALTRLSRHATSLQSGNTSDVIRNHVPSGDQRKPLTPVGNAVAFAGSPPGRTSVQTWELPSRLDRNATRRPSGEKAGSESRFSPVVSGRGAPPAVGASHSADAVRFSATTGVPRA